MRRYDIAGAKHTLWLLALTAAMAVPPSATRAADDAGLGAFFRQQFGIGGDEAPAPTYDVPYDHPLVVRPHHRPVTRHAVAKVVVGPVAPVSIYDDQTLRRGDAVMTAKGLRVFMGDQSGAHTEADFVAVSDVDGLPRNVEKALVAIEKAPHG